MPEIFSSIVDTELAVDAVLAEAVALALDAALIGDGDDGVGVGIVGHAPLRALFSYRLRVAFVSLRVAFAWFARSFRSVECAVLCAVLCAFGGVAGFIDSSDNVLISSRVFCAFVEVHCEYATGGADI